MFFSKSGGAGNNFQSGLEISLEGCPNPDLTPLKACEGVFNVHLFTPTRFLVVRILQGES